MKRKIACGAFWVLFFVVLFVSSTIIGAVLTVSSDIDSGSVAVLLVLFALFTGGLVLLYRLYDPFREKHSVAQETPLIYHWIVSNIGMPLGILSNIVSILKIFVAEDFLSNSFYLIDLAFRFTSLILACICLVGLRKLKSYAWHALMINVLIGILYAVVVLIIYIVFVPYLVSTALVTLMYSIYGSAIIILYYYKRKDLFFVPQLEAIGTAIPKAKAEPEEKILLEPPTRFCRNCGKKIRGKTNYCSNCGMEFKNIPVDTMVDVSANDTDTGNETEPSTNTETIDTEGTATISQPQLDTVTEERSLGGKNGLACTIAIDEAVRTVPFVGETVAQQETTTNETALAAGPLVTRKAKKKFCSRCGNEIDAAAKKCTGCGKQYFKGLSWKTVISVVIVSLLITSCTANLFQYSEVSKLNSTISAAKKEESDLRDDIYELKGELRNYRKQVEFFDEHVVLVGDDGTKLYHKYECSRWQDADGFWAYNVEAAKGKGYKPCSRCH